MSDAAQFNFHDRVGVRVETSQPRAKDFFNAEYGFHQGSYSPSLPQVSFAWQRSRSSSNGFRFHSHKFLARWKYRLNWQQDVFAIESVGNWFALPMVHHMMVHPALRLLSSRAGTLLLHGAAVVKNGRSLILTGMGGAGKTMTSGLILANGGSDWQLHADDYVFVADGECSLAYLTRSHLYSDQLRWTPQIARLLSPVERLQLEFFGRLRKMSRERIKWPVRLDMARLWPGKVAAHTAHIGAVLLLERCDTLRPRLEPAKGDKWIENLLEMNFYEAQYFVNLSSSILKQQGHDDWLEMWRARERVLIEQLTQNTTVLRLLLPRVPVPENSYVDALLSCVEEALAAS